MKITTLFLLSVFGLLLPFTASLADEPEFQKHKQEAMTNIDERIQKLNEHKSCVSAAANKESLRACHDKMKAWHEAERAEHTAKRQGHLDEQIKKLQQKKSELNKK